jgi:hypothetical protein
MMNKKSGKELRLKLPSNYKIKIILWFQIKHYIDGKLILN